MSNFRSLRMYLMDHESFTNENPDKWDRSVAVSLKWSRSGARKPRVSLHVIDLLTNIEYDYHKTPEQVKERIPLSLLNAIFNELPGLSDSGETATDMWQASLFDDADN